MGSDLHVVRLHRDRPISSSKMTSAFADTWYHVFAFGWANLLSSFGDGTDMHGLIYADGSASLAPPAVVEE